MDKKVGRQTPSSRASTGPQSPIFILVTAFRLWWDDWVPMLLLNAGWFLLQLPVLTGPPATAMVYALVRQRYEGDYWGPREAWDALRRLSLPAWKWALLNLVVWLVSVANLFVYWRAPGTMWFLLRLLWIAGLTMWLMLNLFYWPFWLAQADKSLRTTYANCGRFLLRHPLSAVFLTAVSVALTVVSLVTTLPFTLGLICWLALLGVVAVEESLALEKKRGGTQINTD